MTETPRARAAGRDLVCRIVYWGPSRSGKQANLRAVHEGSVPERRDALRAAPSGPSGGRRRDFLAIELGEVSGHVVRLHLHALPGSPYHHASRWRGLAAADGVVFVVDPQARRVQENLTSLRELYDAVAAQGEDPRTFPVVFQYGKQDLPEAMCQPIAAWEALLNPWQAPSFAAVARRGVGVFETLRSITGRALARRAADAASASAPGGGHDA